jgi:hypothetical protein
MGCRIAPSGGWGPNAGANSLADCIATMAAAVRAMYGENDCDCGFAYISGFTVSDPACAAAVRAAMTRTLGAFPITLLEVRCPAYTPLKDCVRTTIRHACRINVVRDRSWRDILRDYARFKKWLPTRAGRVVVTFSIRIVFYSVAPPYRLSVMNWPVNRIQQPYPSDVMTEKPPCDCGPDCGCEFSSPEVSFRVASAESRTGPVELLSTDSDFWFRALYNADRPMPSGIQADLARQ